MIAKELVAFKSLSWQAKLDYIKWFYEDMIKKTDNTSYKIKFQSIIDTVDLYKENESNTIRLINLYGYIIWAKTKTKQKKIEKIEKKIKSNTKKNFKKNQR